MGRLLRGLCFAILTALVQHQNYLRNPRLSIHFHFCPLVVKTIHTLFIFYFALI